MALSFASNLLQDSLMDPQLYVFMTQVDYETVEQPTAEWEASETLEVMAFSEV